MRSAGAFGPTDCIAIIANRGHGKTTLGCTLQPAWPRVVVIDRMSEDVYTRMASSGDPTTAIAQGVRELKRGLEWSIGKPRFTLIYRFPFGMTKRDAELNEVLWLVYKRGSCLLKLEEVWWCASPHFMPTALEDLAYTGRHRGVALLSTTQLPAQMNKKLLGVCAHRFYGNIEEANALRYLAEDLGSDAEKLKTLPKGKFLWKCATAASVVVDNQ